MRQCFAGSAYRRCVTLTLGYPPGPGRAAWRSELGWLTYKNSGPENKSYRLHLNRGIADDLNRGIADDLTRGIADDLNRGIADDLTR